MKQFQKCQHVKFFPLFKKAGVWIKSFSAHTSYMGSRELIPRPRPRPRLYFIVFSTVLFAQWIDLFRQFQDKY